MESRQQNHLTYEDLEIYMDTEDVSEDYLCRVAGIMQHLEECQCCQKLLQRMMLISSVCDEENIAYGLDMLKKESLIRRELFALRIEMAGQDRRMQELANRFRAGLLKRMVSYNPLAIRACMVPRGEVGRMAQSPIQVQFEGGKVKVLVYCEEGQEVTVILEPKEERGAFTIKSVIASEEGRAVLEFEEEVASDKYTFHIDIK